LKIFLLIYIVLGLLSDVKSRTRPMLLRLYFETVANVEIFLDISLSVHPSLRKLNPENWFPSKVIVLMMAEDCVPPEGLSEAI